MLRLFWGAHPSRLLRTRRPLRLRTRRVRFRARTCVLRPPTARPCGSRTPSRRMARGCRRLTAQPSRCRVGSASRSRLGPCSCWVSAGCRLVDNRSADKLTSTTSDNAAHVAKRLCTWLHVDAVITRVRNDRPTGNTLWVILFAAGCIV